MNAFSDGAVVLPINNPLAAAFDDDNVMFKKPLGNSDEKLKSPVLYGLKGNLGKYIVYGTRAVAHILSKQFEARVKYPKGR